MRAGFNHLPETRFFRAVARILIFLLIVQNFPVDGLGRGKAEAAGSIV